MEKFNLYIKGEEFPIYLSENKNSDKLLLYIPGLNGNGALVDHISNKFPGFSVASFDPRAQGDNNSKPSRRYKKYLKDIDFIIKNLKDKTNTKKIYLIGESWGAALSILYKYMYGGIEKIVCWNCPYKINNVEKIPKCDALKRNLKMILTFLFSINTYDCSKFNENLINNKVILRTINVFRRKKVSNKVIIASWKSFKPAWRIIFKNKIDNYLYIQSLEDIMLHNDLLKILNRNRDINIIKYEKGCHVLTFDVESSERLFRDINIFFGNK